MTDEPSLLSIMKGLVGRETACVDEFEVERGMLKRFAIAIGDPNPLYYDEDFARSTAHEDIVAPPTFVFEWNHWKHGPIAREERAHVFSALKRQLSVVRGSSEFEIIQPVRPGDIIKTQSRITEVYEKEGKSGHLVFVVSETQYSNQKGEDLAKSRDLEILVP